MSRTEPDLPSIHTPLAHESTITTEIARTSIDAQHYGAATPFTAERSTTTAPILREPATPPPAANEADVWESGGPLNRDPTQREPRPETSPESEPAADLAGREPQHEQSGRAWPRRRRGGLATPELTDDQIEASHQHGWEP